MTLARGTDQLETARLLLRRITTVLHSYSWLSYVTDFSQFSLSKPSSKSLSKAIPICMAPLAGDPIFG
jgi:hypothetical protein